MSESIRPDAKRKFSQKIVNAAFEGIVRLWPADTRDWARAMQAEAADITDARESFSWLLGGVMSLSKAWMKRILFGSKNSDAVAPRMPGFGAIAMLLIATAALATPMLRQGLTAVVDMWRTPRGGFSDAELHTLARKAEREHDAKMLTFVAMQLPVSLETIRWADEAVSMDPSLMWIYVQMDGSMAPYQIPDQDFAPRIANVEQWDPDNSAGYLAEASRAFENAHWDEGYLWGTRLGGEGAPDSKHRNFDAAAAFAAKNHQWVALMEKAFRAPRFDDYSQRRFELVLNVVREHQIEQPLAVLDSVSSSRLPNFQNVQVYSWALERKGQLSEATDEVSASQAYWEMANFAQQMKIGSHGGVIETIFASNISRRAFAGLQSLLQRERRDDEARYAAYQVQAADAELREIRTTHLGSLWQDRTTLWNGLVLHASAFVVIVSGGLSLLSLLWIGISYRGDSRGAGRRWVCAIARLSPVLLLFSTAVFYTTYFPYASALKYATPENLAHVADPLAAVLSLAYLLSFTGRHYGVVYLWTGITVAGVAIAMMMLVRMTLRAQTDRQATA